MKVITGNKDKLDIYIANKSIENKIVFPENNKDIDQQAEIMSLLPDTFDGELYTLSPWVISDSKETYIVNDDLSLSLFDKFKTFGASINKINMQIFNRRETIGNMALKELKDIKQKVKEDILTIDEALDIVDDSFGESIEKTLFMKFLFSKKED